MPKQRTRILPAQEPEAIEEAADILRAGGLVAFPTDTVYGLGAILWDVSAVARIYVAKQRPLEKAIPVLLTGLAQLAALVDAIPPALPALAGRYWPGPLTVVIECSRRLPAILSSGAGTVAVRAPNHPIALSLIAKAGEPLAATSANRSGEASPQRAQDVMDQLGGRIDAIVDGGTCPGGQPSTVLDLTASPPKILRPGPITRDELRSILIECE